MIYLVATLVTLAAWDASRRWATRPGRLEDRMHQMGVRIEAVALRADDNAKVLANHASVLKQHDATFVEHGRVLTKLNLAPPRGR